MGPARALGMEWVGYGGRRWAGSSRGGRGLVPLNSWTTSLLFASRMTDSGFREGLSKVNKTASGRELL